MTTAGPVERSAPRRDVQELRELLPAARVPVDGLAALLGTSHQGLSEGEVTARRAQYGPNTLGGHRVQPVRLLARQIRSPLLALLAVAAVMSAFVGQRADAAIIGSILVLSVGLGFVNEFRAERTAAALHDRLRHRAHVVRDGAAGTVDVTELVPGDLVRLSVGMVVPADLRLTSVTGLECDESVLTGESVPVAKGTAPAGAGRGAGELAYCALMGTVVRAGNGLGFVVATGHRSVFGSIAGGLAQPRPTTAFQLGLARFSGLLARFAAVLTVGIFAVNLVLDRPVMDALLFSLAIAVGITPQLLPAVVTTSLATGSRRLARRKVLVKRLLGIEDLGNVDVLFTDKTGTLTESRVAFDHAVVLAAGMPERQLLRLAVACSDLLDAGGGVAAVADNPLDQALYERAGSGRRSRWARRWPATRRVARRAAHFAGSDHH